MQPRLILCAIALVAFAANSARAAIDVQLNLRYVDPLCEHLGGTWDLLVESTDPTQGVFEIDVLIDNLIDSINIDAAFTGSTGWSEFSAQQVGPQPVPTVAPFRPVRIKTGADPLLPFLAARDVGVVGGASVSLDDLWSPTNTVWTHSSLVASGTFGAMRPVLSAANPLNAKVIGGTGGDVPSTYNRLSVRGNGYATDGLYLGDANQDGVVTSMEVAISLTNMTPFPTTLPPNCSNTSSCTYAEGDTDKDGKVTNRDIVEANSNIGKPPVLPPAIVAGGTAPAGPLVIYDYSTGNIEFQRLAGSLILVINADAGSLRPSEGTNPGPGSYYDTGLAASGNLGWVDLAGITGPFSAGKVVNPGTDPATLEFLFVSGFGQLPMVGEIQTINIPEPNCLLLAGFGAVAVIAARRRRQSVG